jgi:hypothetical protein
LATTISPLSRVHWSTPICIAFLTMSFDRPNGWCASGICSPGSTNCEPQGKTTPRRPHTHDPTSLWSSSTRSSCTYTADLGSSRLDLAEEEHTQEPAGRRCVGRGVCQDERHVVWRCGRC